MSLLLLADAITSRPLFPSDTQIDYVATNIQNSPIYSETLHYEFKTSIKIKESIYVATLPVPVCRYQISLLLPMSIHNLIGKMRNLILVYSLAWFTTLKRILS